MKHELKYNRAVANRPVEEHVYRLIEGTNVFIVWFELGPGGPCSSYRVVSLQACRTACEPC